MPSLNLEDQIFGKLVVVDKVGKDKHGCNLWYCLCECGGFRTVSSGKLTAGKVTHCGCEKPANLRDLTGQKFGMLTPLYIDPKNKGRRVKWICQCDCGKFKSVIGWSLTSGNTQSCGCLVGKYRKGEKAKLD